MPIVTTFAFLAGVLTILSPCALPVIPLVLGASATGGWRRAAGIFAGFGGTFIATTVLFASVLAAAGLNTNGLRTVSAVLLGLVGVTLVSERVGGWAARFLAPVAELGTRLVGGGPGRGPGHATVGGTVGGLVLGAGIGLVWAPCVGPIMAGVIAAAVTGGPSIQTVVVATAYVAGAIVPLSLIAIGGIRARDALGRAARRTTLRRSFGGAMVLSALLIVGGLDLTIENGVASVLPAGWSSALGAIDQGPDIQQEISVPQTDPSRAPRAPSSTVAPGMVALPAPIATSLPGEVGLSDLGPAPDPVAIQAWINSQPLTMRDLRGKVVLVEFWTFDCINCQHVQPFVKAWYDRYAAAGFVVVGVHSPELSFERDLANVREAVSQADIRYPVAVDPSFATWNAYRNAYWPAFYFIDRTGHIRYVHAGEGDYDGSEQVIRELLAEGT